MALDPKAIEQGWLNGNATRGEASDQTTQVSGARLARLGEPIFTTVEALLDWLLGFRDAAGSSYEATMHGRHETAMAAAARGVAAGKPLRNPTLAFRLISGETPGETTPTPDGEGEPVPPATAIGRETQLIEQLNDARAERDKLKAELELAEGYVGRLTVALRATGAAIPTREEVPFDPGTGAGGNRT